MAAVLVIEDDPDFLEIARHHLEGAGHAVTEARTVAEAGREAGLTTPAVVLLDLRLPDGDGWTALAAVRSVIGPKVPVVVISAHTSGHSIERAQAEGCRAYLRKPVDAKTILAAVSAALSDDPWGFRVY